MARERLVSAEAAVDDAEEAMGPALRPRKLQEYVGQTDLVERVRIAVQAAKGRGEPMDHVLLHGPPGLGKTTLAHVIAAEMGTRAVVTSGPALTKAGDLVGTLTRLGAGDVLFIDEIHRLPAAVEEYIYPAMEEYRVDFTVDQGMHARMVTLPLKPFTLIGATTRAGLLTQALRSRFGLSHHLDFYGQEELERILLRAADLLGVKVDAPSVHTLAARSRGTPRVALRLLRRVRDWAQVKGKGRVDAEAVRAGLELEGVDASGLDELDRKYLRTLARTYKGGPVGLETLAATIGEDADTLEDLVEPFLLRSELLARTRQGRRLTAAGAAMIGERLEGTELFES
ncbi:MAG: Holliday junction branch migration DNA helicase RuvB [Planctomycetaceae bacterium]|nr:Holliday junction branch migration DNA helicase RuvB [Planctomycetaceae bacterium]